MLGSLPPSGALVLVHSLWGLWWVRVLITAHVSSWQRGPPKLPATAPLQEMLVPAAVPYPRIHYSCSLGPQAGSNPVASASLQWKNFAFSAPAEPHKLKIESYQEKETVSGPPEPTRSDPQASLRPRMRLEYFLPSGLRVDLDVCPLTCSGTASGGWARLRSGMFLTSSVKRWRVVPECSPRSTVVLRALLLHLPLWLFPLPR